MRHFRVAAVLLGGVLGLSSLASAAPIDPIVRVREGDWSGSLSIKTQPFVFGFLPFPENPDPLNCGVGTETIGGVVEPLLSCIFQNQTGSYISLLDLTFTPTIPDGFALRVDDPDNLFVTEFIEVSGARFAGGGIRPQSCDVRCVSGDFVVDLVGFPEGTVITMTASVLPVPEPVPEPGSFALFGTGLALAALRRRRPRHASRTRKCVL